MIVVIAVDEEIFYRLHICSCGKQ